MNGQKRTCLTLLILIASLLSSCGSNSSGEGPPTNTEVEFEGVYAQGFEDSWFYSCEYDNSGWKPVLNDESFGQLQEFWENRDPDGGPLMRMQIMGVLSKKGTYRGIFAGYEREIQILDILQIEYTDDTDC